MLNRTELAAWVEGQPIGQTLYIATSQYATNTTPPGFTFDEYANAAAVRALIRAGVLEGECGWRYYEVRRPTMENDNDHTDEA